MDYAEVEDDLLGGGGAKSDRTRDWAMAQAKGSPSSSRPTKTSPGKKPAGIVFDDTNLGGMCGVGVLGCLRGGV